MLATLVTAFLWFSAFAQTPNSQNQVLALVGGTIYTSPVDEAIRNGVIVINDGKITAVGTRARVQVPRGAQVVDCSGLTITAGFWNSHVHFFERKWANAAQIPAAELARQLQDMLSRYGFTGAFDLSSMWENTRRLRERIESGEVPGPRIRSTGEALLPQKPGIPPDAVLGVMGVMTYPAPEVGNEVEAASASRKLLDAGVDGIKLFASAPSKATFSEAAIQAVVSQAHRTGKPVFAHPNNAADVLAAIRNGVDVIVHTTPGSGPWDQTLLSTAKERRVALIPTLWIWKYYARHDRLSVQEKTADTAVGQLRAWIANGGRVLFGTDLGAVDPDPSEEYALMAGSGMSFHQILASLTTAPAEQFGESRRLGRIAAGFEADLVVLKADPSRNIQALTAVKYTLRAGKFIYREDR
jgi:imidazolonepropionase-like amidohydrolase